MYDAKMVGMHRPLPQKICDLTMEHGHVDIDR